MDEAPLLGGVPSPEDELVSDLFGVESQFVSEHLGLETPVVKREEDEFQAFKDAYLSSVDPKEPLLQAFNPPLAVDCKRKVKVEFLAGEQEEQEAFGEYPGLPELNALEDTVLPAVPPPQAYNVHFLSSLLTPHRSPAVVPLGAWAREGAAHAGVRVIPVELKEAGAAVPRTSPEEAASQTPLAQEHCCKFPSLQEAEDTPGCSHKKDPNPMVLCQLKGGAQVLCIDSSGAGGLKALHLVPPHQDQSSCLQPDVPKPATTLVGRLLPAPARLNLIAQPLDGGPLLPVVSGTAFPAGSALPGPPKLALAGYCDCFASGDFCGGCRCSNCCNNLRHGAERLKAVKACLDRNPEAFQPKTGLGRRGDVRPRHSRGCNCRRSGCLKNYCECYEAKIMCSSICKCIGCKNYEESPERKTLMDAPNSAGAGGVDGGHCLSPTKCPALPRPRRDRRTPSCISREVVEAACACLLAQGEEAEKDRCPPSLAQQRVLEEFGRCLAQILQIEFKSKGLTVE
ncbi:Tesmin [Galemys pyrenaicus]|uniref:Tesmin n=1 Tax=Galemys pyrenaicus TaxID=202257 RepID=A0A8J6DVU4_GALPY|nr:Tesmin [Galemys pyrenaicus]